MAADTAPPPEVIEPAAPAEGTQQIEASVTPPAQPDAQPKVEAVAAADTPAPSAQATASAAPSDAAPLPQEKVQAMAAPEAPASNRPKPCRSRQAMPVQEVAAPAPAPAEYNGRSGYGFLNVSASPADTARLSGENVSSMMVMTEPIAADAVAPARRRSRPSRATRSDSRFQLPIRSRQGEAEAGRDGCRQAGAEACTCTGGQAAPSRPRRTRRPPSRLTPPLRRSDAIG